MTMLHFDRLGEWGVVKDVRDFQLPSNAWTDALNIRIRDHQVEPVGGSESVFSPEIAPYWLLHTVSPALEHAWVFAGLTKVYARISGSNSNITRQSGMSDVDYSATADNLWTGGVLGGIPVINNGVDVPQQWAPVGAATKLADLSNWDANWVAGSIRPFKNFLIAMKMTESSTEYVHRVRTSHPAVPGAVPASWDATDATVDATRFDLSDVESGPIVDGLALRELFLVYKERSTHSMQFVGGRNKFQVTTLSETSGMLTKNCAAPEPNGLFHFVATGNDIIVCDGFKVESLLERRLKKWLQSNISSTNYNRSFCVTNKKDNECWFCFPLEGSTWCNMALVWNKQDNAFTFRELEQLSHIAPGQITIDGVSWNDAVGSWDDQVGTWSTLTDQPFLRPLLGAAPASTKLLSLDVGLQNQGANFASRIERTGLAALGSTRSGEVAMDLTKKRLIRRVWLNGEGGIVYISIATQQKIGGPISWSGRRTFDLTTRRAADFHQHGVLWGIRIESDGGVPFSVNSFEVEVEELGQF